MQLQATTRVAPDFTEPDLAETCFWVTEEYASDETNGVNNAVSRYRR